MATAQPRQSLLKSKSASRFGRLGAFAGEGFLFLVTAASAATILFIFYYIIRDSVPFFRSRGFAELFTGREWYPSHDPPSFGALSLFVGSGLVTGGAMIVAVPMGVFAAVCLSDILPFGVRQAVKPIIEILAAIPSVALGFFALVVFAPLLQDHGGPVLAAGLAIAGVPVLVILAVVLGDLATHRLPGGGRRAARIGATVVFLAIFLAGLALGAARIWDVQVSSGANALNVSIILGIMALPTVVSVSEDALSAVGRDLREASYGVGATRAETLVRVVIPAARSGILAAVLLGVMRAVGETMVVWMASGNAAQIPTPWYNLLQPVRTLTATIAGDMGEADQVTGSDRYSVLFALALCLLVFSFVCNLVSEWAVRKSRARSGG